MKKVYIAAPFEDELCYSGTEIRFLDSFEYKKSCLFEGSCSLLLNLFNILETGCFLERTTQSMHLWAAQLRKEHGWLLSL
jgi:hypothetical protein